MQAHKSPANIAIAGAGIGGLTAALALARQGHEVDIYEQAPGFSEVGAGLQLSPNAVRVLRALGLEKALDLVGFQPRGLEVRHWKNGHCLAAEAFGESAIHRWGAPYYHIHRADLHGVLLEAVLARPNITLHNDAHCADIGQDERSAWLQPASGGKHRHDLLVGADGIHSIVREKLWGSQQPRFTGNVAWRLLVPASRLPEGLVEPVASLWLGPGAHFVHYLVRDGDDVNCVCVEEQSRWQNESWTERGDKADLKQAFSGWHDSIQTLIDAADADRCYRWALYDRDPMPHWGKGRITLLGDACHPTLPFLAQGAAMAIEDAAMLARCLSEHPPPERALLRYEELRKPRTARVQLVSRRNGRIYHMRGPMAAARNLALRTGLASPRKTTEWLYA